MKISVKEREIEIQIEMLLDIDGVLLIYRFVPGFTSSVKLPDNTVKKLAEELTRYSNILESME